MGMMCQPSSSRYLLNSIPCLFSVYLPPASSCMVCQSCLRCLQWPDAVLWTKALWKEAARRHWQCSHLMLVAQPPHLHPLVDQPPRGRLLAHHLVHHDAHVVANDAEHAVQVHAVLHGNYNNNHGSLQDDARLRLLIALSQAELLGALSRHVQCWVSRWSTNLVLLVVVSYNCDPPVAEQVLVHELLHRLEVGAQPDADERQVRGSRAEVAALQVPRLPHIPHNVDA
jgi:hypothetical protein